jgi:UDP-GlcNAc:undecaprenyl-phosphate/decaprenyl-phosphate GlcNAc-1-phosphate transferase
LHKVKIDNSLLTDFCFVSITTPYFKPKHPFISSLLTLFLVTFFTASLGLSVICIYFSRKLALKFHILDDPKKRPDKKQKAPVPFLGGVGFILVCSLLMSVLWLFNKFDIAGASTLLSQNLIYHFRLYWILIAIGIMTIGGIIDDKYALSSKWLAMYVVLAIIVAVVGGGLKIEAFSYPFNLFLPTSGFLPQVLAFIWVLACTAATKFLDGHDGLVGSVSIVSLLSIASISLFSNVAQPLIFLFALIWAGGVSAFLFFNFPDAKLYLGESGAEVVGFIIGVLSILSGAKVATASTVIGWFILDFILVIILRYIQKRPLFKADRSHWHHRLVDMGLNKIQVLVATVIVMLGTAHLGLMLPTEKKGYVLVSQFILLLGFLVLSLQISKNKNTPTGI